MGVKINSLKKQDMPMNRYFIQKDIQRTLGTTDLLSASNQKTPTVGLNKGGRNRDDRAAMCCKSKIAIVFVLNAPIELQIKAMVKHDFPAAARVTRWLPNMRAVSHNHDRDAQPSANQTTSPTNKPVSDLKLVEFSLEMPNAKIVQLAADFTDWEAAPIDMIRFVDGMWSTTVPLPPGVYAYRYLVDGVWYDDPRVVRRNPNSAGVAEAIIK